jgi:hypothetical protein
MDDNPYAAPSVDAIGPGSGIQAGACPLCGETRRMKKPKQLYDVPVCPRCTNGFASRRQMAFVIDSFLFQLAIVMPVWLVAELALPTATLSAGIASGRDWLITFALWGAFCSKDSFLGLSPGKYLCGVRVIDGRTGAAIGWASSFKRNLPLLIPIIPLIVAVQLIKGHRLGDKWSNSKVIWSRYADRPFFGPDTAVQLDPLAEESLSAGMQVERTT